MYSGDSNPWRDLGFARWFDPYAAYEDVESPQFKAALEAEAAAFNAGLTKVARAKPVKEFETLMSAALPLEPSAAQETALWRGTSVYIQHADGDRKNVWIVSGGTFVRKFTDLTSFGVDPESNLYFTITDIGNGDQTLQLAVYELGIHSPHYTIDPVGPHAAFKSEYLYYESITNQLRSSGIHRVDKRTGRKNYTVYAEKDLRVSVELFAPPRQPDLFFRTANALSQRLARLTGHTFEWMTPTPPKDGEGETLIPVTNDVYAGNTALVVDGDRIRYPRGAFLLDVVPANSPSTLLVATVKAGVASVYLFEVEDRRFKSLFEGKEPCNVMLHSHASIPSFTRTSYYEPNAVYEVQDDSAVHLKTSPEPVKLIRHSHGVAAGEKGAKIPYTFVSAVKKPQKLLVTAYGAYGISARRTYPKRWLPWLKRGYAIVEAMPRGGRENGDAWYDAARTAVRKQTTFDDTAAVIAAVQRRYRFRPAQTAVYGRSAGGWTAAYVGQTYPQLLGAVYAEVPYLDVLRTSSNPKLPLTVLEYDEFGDPAGRPVEYAALQVLSPVDRAAAAPPSAPFFLVETALHDTQVYPYEALKFAAKMRGLGWPIVVDVDRSGGHFVKKESMASQHANAFLLIDAALRGKEGARQTRRRRQARSMLRSQSSRGTTRRRASSRKH
jgi:cephalosporin-C deacetylase-like acetyl esterase